MKEKKLFTNKTDVNMSEAVNRHLRLEERCRQGEFREKFRANLAKDILLTVMRGGNIPLLHSPQGVTSFTTQMVDYALQVTDYFMAKVYDEVDKEGEE